MADDDPAGLESAADQLYAATPEEFLAARTALVKQARADRDRPLATAVQGLRRPTRSAWLVNLLARQASEELAGLLEIGAALREAQEHLAADELRSLSQERRRAVDGLVRRAVSLGAEHDYAAPEAARQEVSETLQAALADPAAGEQVRRGVLAQPLAYGGFGPLDLAAAAAPRTPAKKSGKEAAKRADLKLVPPPTGSDEDAGEQDPAAAEAAAAEAAERARREAAAAELAAAVRVSEQARQQAVEATAEADRLAEEVDELRVRLAEAEQASIQAQRQARTARREAERAESTRAAAAERAEQ